MQMYLKTTDFLWNPFLPWNNQSKYETISKSQKENHKFVFRNTSAK